MASSGHGRLESPNLSGVSLMALGAPRGWGTASEDVLRLHHGEQSRTLYTGVTSNLERHVLQYRGKLLPGFTGRYNINRLVYYEVFGDIVVAIGREKQVKSWGRGKKIALIESLNRDWKDLSAAW